MESSKKSEWGDLASRKRRAKVSPSEIRVCHNSGTGEEANTIDAANNA